MTTIRNILFDLDGTLVDSAGDIIDCLERAYSAVPSISNVLIKRTFIGPPLSEVIKLTTPNISQAESDSIIKEFRIHYDNSDYPNTVVFEGVHELIFNLRNEGRKLFVVTNKPFVPTCQILKKINKEYFSDVITPDCIPGTKMEKTEMVSHLIEKWNLNKKECIMVGDSDSDVQAAQLNGIASVAVLSGYGDRKSIADASPDYTLEKISFLHGLLLNG